MLKPSDITIDRLKTGMLKKELPEFYDLRRVVEKNAWHDKEMTFNHTLAVLSELETLLAKYNNAYLNESTGNCKRKDLVFLAALLHDLGKPDAYLINEDDTTSFPEHEKIGAQKAAAVLKRFDLLDWEVKAICDMIRYHGAIHDMINPKDAELDKKLAEFRQEHKGIFFELMLLCFADTLASNLKLSRPADFQFRIAFYQKALRMGLI